MTSAGALVARMRPGGGGAWSRGDAALVWVEGPEAEGLLQGVLTCDVSALAASESALGLMLDVKGRIRVDLRVYRDAGGGFTLVTSPWLGQDLADALEAAMVSEDALVLGPEPTEVVTLFGAEPPADAPAELALAGRVRGSWDLMGRDTGAVGAALGLPEAPAPLAEALRIAAGVPLVGPDLPRGEVLVHEAGLEGLAVSFHKGCYLGQETVARVQYRGKVNRTLRLLALEGPVAAGESVLAAGKRVGRCGPSAQHPDQGWIALAIVRREVAVDDAVTVAGIRGTVHRPPVTPT